MRQIIRCAALIAAVSLAVPVAADAQREGRSRIDTTFAFSKGGSVELRVISGDIIVTGWTRPEMKITASVEQGTIESVITSSRVSLGSRMSRFGNGEAHFELMVPIRASGLNEIFTGR